MVEPKRMADQDTGVEIWSVYSMVPESPSDVAPHRIDAKVGAAHARAPLWGRSCAASNEAWCSVTRASMISSSASPSITWGSL